MEEIKEVLKYLPFNIQEEIKNKITEWELDKKSLGIEEIRIRMKKPIGLKIGQENIILKYIITERELREIFEKICENSVYSYRKQICEGFITIKGGHRVGITGSAVIENEKIINMNYISSLNFRIARQKIGCSKEILKYIIKENNDIYNTLIISPPGCGKTTMLRDIIRNLSNGISSINFFGKTIGLVDERGEIASMYKGIPQNDVGVRTDVVENISKSKGMKMIVRSMSPNIISCDEIGSKEDSEAISYAMCAGVRGIFTAHGGNLEDIKNNNELNFLLEKKMLDRVILLDKFNLGKINKIYLIEKDY